MFLEKVAVLYRTFRYTNKKFLFEEFASLAFTWQSFKCLINLIKKRQEKEKEHRFVIPTHNVRSLTSNPMVT